MQVHTSPKSLHLLHPSVTLGIFDGVHRGHQKLLACLKETAEQTHSQTLVITFWPHPRILLGKVDPNFRLLSSLPEKTKLMENMGVDHLLIMPFTQEFANQPAEEFLAGFLNRYIKPGVIVAGDDLTFGASGSGNIDLLTANGKTHGFEVKRFETNRDHLDRISSTRIRNYLLTGHVESANELLGYPYFITGSVVAGNQIGRAIGFPTANIECSEPLKQIPSDGVYAVWVSGNGKTYKGMLNIGFRPTIPGATNRTIEVNLFDTAENLYGQTLSLSFIARLRDELKFNNLDELKARLVLDSAAARATLDKY